MQLSNQPTKLVLPFSSSGSKNTVPVSTSPTPGLASFTDGFPPLTRTAIAAGGIPPAGLDLNGVLYQLTTVLRWANTGAGYTYDSAYATNANISGYPKGARIARTDGAGYWLSTTDNNTTDPESSGAAAAGWVPDFATGSVSVAMSSSNVTLTPLQYGKNIIVITGTLTANVNLIFPNISNTWVIVNNTTGAFTLTAKTSAGTGPVIASSSASLIYGDSTNIYNTASIGVTPEQEQNQIYTYFTTGGSTGAFTLTPSPAVASLSSNPRFTVKFSANGNGSDTINVSGLGVKNLKQYNSSGVKSSPVLYANQIADIKYDGTDWVILNPIQSSNADTVDGYHASDLLSRMRGRQVILRGPYDGMTSNSAFLPATSAGLSISAINIASNPLVINAAGGNSANDTDRIASVTSATWSGLTANATNYLFISPALDGTWTTFSSTIAPLVTDGSPPVVSGQRTFSLKDLITWVGNGTSVTPETTLCVGHAVTNGTGVTSTVCYAYNGRYTSGWQAIPSSGVRSFYNSAIGVTGEFQTIKIDFKCTSTDQGWSVGDIIEGMSINTTNGYMANLSIYKTQSNISFILYSNVLLVQNKTTGAFGYIDPSKWVMNITVQRKF